VKCENGPMRRGHSISERELQPTRAEGDTASRAVAIDSDLGSERLELHVTNYEPGRSLPRSLEGIQEILYTASGRGTLLVDGEPNELEPRTGAYVAAGESYEVENPGPETLLLVSATAPNENGAPPAGRRTVRYDDQPSLPASGDREFRYLVTDEVGCRDLTQFFGVIAPGRAPDHSHVYDEVIYVLEGEGTLHIDGEHEPVAAGTCIHLPPLREHSLENSGAGPMKVVAVFHPAGDPASRAYEANE
jgi:mannose-6-phosphate isomerase-like protein (cupin superfamily)